ncbi:MAG: hypothetical protein JWL90_135 [Chthoniobacteraceae bacterium]|nr:hypothetical protein [Chthoniobacteraceae bacterium]
MIEQREALLKLLRDDDPVTLDLVKDQLTQAGVASLGELRALLAAADPAAARHVRDVIAVIEESNVDEVFTQLCETFPEHGDLEEAAWRLAMTFSPGTDFSYERELLDEWGVEVAKRLRKAHTPLDRVETLAEYLSHEVQLRGNEEDYYNLENSLLPNVIATGLGIPISLSLVYMLVGRRAGLSIEGVGLPGHFMVRHEEIFFDPFHGGRRIGLDECRALMEQQDMVLKPEHLMAATPRQILTRILTNLFYVAERSNPLLAAKIADWIASVRGG